MKALIWKEIKEIWQVWLISLVNFLLFLAIAKVTGFNIKILWVFPLYLELYSGFLGARSFAGEKIGGTLDYLYNRPIHPRTLLIVKYLIGYLQICFFYYLIHYVFTVDTYIRQSYGLMLVNYDIFRHLGLSLSLFSLFGIYSFCFLFSMLVNDTLRALFVGFFVTCLAYFMFVKVLMGWFWQHLALTFNTMIFRYPLYQYLIEIFILGVIGIVYYSLYRKRLIWKTGFSLLILLGISIPCTLILLSRGNISPISKNNQLGLREMHYFNNHIYGFGSHGQLQGINISNPNRLEEVSLIGILTTMNSNYISKIDGQYLYAVEHYPSNPQLVVYKITSNNVALEIERISFQEDTSRLLALKFKETFLDTYNYFGKDSTFSWGMSQMGKRSSYVWHTVYIYPKDNFVFLKHLVKTSEKNWKLFSQFTTQHDERQFDFRQYPLYQEHLIQIDKKTWKITDQLDTDSNLRQKIRHYLDGQVVGNYSFYNAGNAIEIYDVSNWKEPIVVSEIKITPPYPSIDDLHYNPPIFIMKGNYLYTRTLTNPLVIYDLSDIKNPRKVGEAPWDWTERGERRYLWGGMDILSNKRVVVSYERGVLVFDVSHPQKPLQIGKTVDGFIMDMLSDNNFLYISSQSNGLNRFEVYRIP